MTETVYTTRPSTGPPSPTERGTDRGSPWPSPWVLVALLGVLFGLPATAAIATAAPDGPSGPSSGPERSEARVVAGAATEPVPVSLVADPVRRAVDLGTVRIELDVPAGPGPHPTIVFVHGGGWVEGRADELPAGFGLDRLSRRGVALASVDYRLAGGDVTAADQVDDVVAALRWLATEGATQDVGPAAVIVGHSAGAHLAALAVERSGPGAPDLLIGVAGVYDFGPEIRSNPLLAPVLPAALGCAPSRCDTAHLGALTPGRSVASTRVTVVHGDDDPFAPLSTAQGFVGRLLADGADARLVVVEGGQHGGGVLAAMFDAILTEVVGERSI